jgi:hypothetical protein
MLLIILKFLKNLNYESILDQLYSTSLQLLASYIVNLDNHSMENFDRSTRIFVITYKSKIKNLNKKKCQCIF